MVSGAPVKELAWLGRGPALPWSKDKDLCERVQEAGPQFS